jgi:hypothetical protein
MARRNKSFDAIGALENLLFLGAVGVGAYYIFEMLSTPTIKDPTTGQPVGLLNQAMNALFPLNFPGGGEVVGSPETYTGATAESALHPLTTLSTLATNQEAISTPTSFGYQAGQATRNAILDFLAPTAPAMTINTIVPGTGQTVAELQNAGWSNAEIMQMFGGGNTDTESGYAAPGYGP